MTTIPGYPVGVAFSGGESIGVGLSIPGIYALPEDLTAPLEALNSRINAFRDAATFFVSKSATASDSNDGTSPGEPLRSLGAAVAKANAYVTANPDALCSIHLNPGTYTESGLPYRVRRNICIKGDGILRTTTIRPAAGEEKKGFFKVDSGFMAWGLTFAGHQANDLLGKQSWAISFDELADNTTFGANSPGAYIQLSPYIQNCSSITAAQDAGFAPSTSVGETGGGILVDGKACALNSPIRSMVVDSYTQVNLGGPGCLVINDGYAQLVSFFGTFCTYHVRVETGGQVNLSGGTTDFGTYGLMADGYSPSAIYTGEALQPFFGAPLLTRFGLVFAGTSLFTSVGHGFSINDILTPNGASGSPLPDELVNGQSYFVIADGFTADTFRVASSQGGPAIVIATEATVQFLRSGVLEVDIINFSANRLGPISRPNPGQLMFPRLNYPSAGTLGSPGNPATVATVSGVQFTLNLQSTTFKHEWSGGGTITVGGSATYPITSLTYDFGSGLTTITAAGYTPQVGDSITIAGASFICPSESVYVITGSIPIDANGNTVAFGANNQAGYRLQFFSKVNRGLRYPLAQGQTVDFRLRSQISAPGHTFEYVGSGTNYNALPWRGGIPIRANERVEENNGRIFSSNTNEIGDFKVGDAFSVDGTTGSVTINTDQFNLSGLNFIGPFSRNGGFSTVGVQLQEVSNDPNLISSTGTPDGNTVPTQLAVKTYTDTNLTSAVAAATTALEAYTDAEISTATTALQGYTDTAAANTLAASQSYTDAEITSLDASLRSYTDLEIGAATTALESYTDTAAANALAASETYTDAQITSLDASLRNYTDLEIGTATTALQGYTDTAAANTLAASQTYTDTSVATSTTALEQYVQTYVSTVEINGGTYTG
jgi:hypothetical protein